MSSDPTAAVLALLQRVLNLPEISANAQLGQTKGWTSLTHLRVITELEQEFGVRIRATHVARLVSVAQIVQFLREGG